jgi:DnaJ like chaperone protein
MQMAEKSKKRIYGKLVGAALGLSFGGPLGALLGLVIGHAHDNRPDGDDPQFWQARHPQAQGFSSNDQQRAFTMGVIVLGAKMCKADGRVTREEVEAFKRVFHVPPSQVNSVGQLFDQARRSADGFEPYAFHLANVFRNRSAVLEEVLSGLFMIAIADSGTLSQAETRFLERVAVIFDFSVEDFIRIAARSGVRLAQKDGEKKVRDENFAILGLPETASAEQIKITYRALIRKHHPDKLVAQGMPPEFINNATEKMKRINGAYDAICKAKGIK